MTSCASRLRRATLDLSYDVRAGRCPRSAARSLDILAVMCERQRAPRGVLRHAQDVLAQYQERCGAHLSGARRRKKRRR